MKHLLAFALMYIGLLVENPTNTFLGSQATPWPPVTFPDNFALEVGVYTFNKATQKLEQWQNTTVVQWMDTTGNRGKVVTSTFLERLGFHAQSSYVDYATGEVITKIMDL